MKSLLAKSMVLGLTGSLVWGFAAVAGPPRGYSIPLIDLAGQKHRQVIVDKEPGQYLGHPTTMDDS